MERISSSSNLLTQLSTIKPNTLSLQHGEIVLGRIVKFLPNEQAILQIGSKAITAQLEASVEALKSYWFQAYIKDSKIKLKVIAQSFQGRALPLHEQLLQTQKLPVTSETTAFLKQLIKEQIPFTNKQLKQGVEWLLQLKNSEGFHSIEEEINTLLFVIKRKWPITESIIESIRTASKSSFVFSMYELFQALNNGEGLTESNRSLLRFLQHFISNGTDKNSLSSFISVNNVLDTNRHEFKQFLKQITVQLGLHLENTLKKGVREEIEQQRVAFKSLLIEAIKGTKDDDLRLKMENVLSHLNGQTLLSHDQGPLTHFYLFIPLILKGWLTDWKMQFFGKKRMDGTIDPNFCRIVFDLKLKNIEKSLIDVLIQHKVITIHIYNNHLSNNTVTPFIKTLREKLRESGYQLSSITVSPYSQNVLGKDIKPFIQQKGYEKVDIKV